MLANASSTVARVGQFALRPSYRYMISLKHATVASCAERPSIQIFWDADMRSSGGRVVRSGSVIPGTFVPFIASADVFPASAGRIEVVIVFVRRIAKPHLTVRPLRLMEGRTIVRCLVLVIV